MDTLAKQILDGVPESLKQTMTPLQWEEMKVTGEWLAEHARRELMGTATPEQRAVAKTVIGQLDTNTSQAAARAFRESFETVIGNVGKVLVALVK